MSKSKIDTSLMFLTAVCVIFGGWFLTEGLLIRREERFLNSTGTIAVQSERIGLLADNSLETAQEQAAEPEEFQGREMTEDTRALVLAVWEYGGRELPHEPLPGQMNMKQAIDAGKKWVETMASHDVFTEALQECDFDVTKAELCTIDTPIRTSMEEMLYSYWKIWFIKDGASVELTIHAASGEVWKAKVSVASEDACVEVFDIAYLLQYAFPFMEEGLDKTWMETVDLAGQEDVDVVLVKARLLHAEAKQYCLRTNEKPPQAVIEFTLHGTGYTFDN